MNLLMNYRVSHRILIQAKSHFFFGLNRWKDMKTFKHKLQDVLIGDLSLSQSFHYYPKHARTPIFGIGLLQGVHYIHSRGFRIEWGLLFNMGMRL